MKYSMTGGHLIFEGRKWAKHVKSQKPIIMYPKIPGILGSPRLKFVSLFVFTTYW